MKSAMMTLLCAQGDHDTVFSGHMYCRRCLLTVTCLLIPIQILWYIMQPDIVHVYTERVCNHQLCTQTDSYDSLPIASLELAQCMWTE